MIEMDTPGGLGSSMRDIVKGILAAKIPVIVYVAPPGASADSAGAVIGMSADVLAMAPQTNIGSSTPISIGGEDISKDLRRKVVNDAAAYIGELAREHGRNVAVARHMVTVATNLGAREALQKNVIDVLAKDYPDLFRQIDGMKTEPKGLTISTPPDTTDRTDPDVGLEAAPRPADRPEHHCADALHRPDWNRGRALEPGSDLPGDRRRDLADRRPLRAPGAACLDRRPAPDAARCRLLRRRGVHRLARGARRSPARSPS